jgi:hypothetical protein
MVAMSGYLAACAIFRNEARYLAEWTAFHLAVGVDHLFLYNNLSEDGFASELAPFVEEGDVTLVDWPAYPGQNEAYDDCVARTRGAWRWVAFIDLDEFLFSPRVRPVPELLKKFEHVPGVGVPWVQFGTSGHSTPPPGLVIENYTRRLGLDRPRSRVVKCIVDPTAVIAVGFSAHYFRYGTRGLAVTERHEPYRGEMTESVSVDLLRINHYFTRSQEERERKLAAPRVDNGKLKNREGVEKRDLRLNEEPDEVILSYAPVLRGALGLEASAPGLR